MSKVSEHCRREDRFSNLSHGCFRLFRIYFTNLLNNKAVSYGDRATKNYKKGVNHCTNKKGRDDSLSLKMKAHKCASKAKLNEDAFSKKTVPMLSNRPGGARIGPKIPDWMSNNLAGKEK